MAHPLISTIVIALALAWVLGSLAHRLRLPPIVGYLLAAC
jgi:CPA2 family monovalent cation:H+ antiporter-2